MSGMKERRYAVANEHWSIVRSVELLFNCVHVCEGVSHTMGAVEKLLSTFKALMHLFNLF